MGIDGIGKPPGAPPATGASGAGAIRGDTFRVDQAPSVQGTGADDLDKLRRGEIDLDAYVEARVSEAVAHLENKLAPEQLEFVRQTLREQLATDPVLVEHVRRATGAVVAER